MLTHEILIVNSDSVLVVGKSGLIASRLAASLSSIGISSQYVSAVEWRHGDLGMRLISNYMCVCVSFSLTNV